jgi:hypothetical protein
VAGLAPDPDGSGYYLATTTYWVARADGTVYTFGKAATFTGTTRGPG